MVCAVISHSLWDDLAGDEVVARSLFKLTTPMISLIVLTLHVDPPFHIVLNLVWIPSSSKWKRGSTPCGTYTHLGQVNHLAKKSLWSPRRKDSFSILPSATDFLGMCSHPIKKSLQCKVMNPLPRKNE